MTHRPHSFPDRLHVWVVRPLRGQSANRFVVLSRALDAARVDRRLRRVPDVQLHHAFVYDKLSPGYEWGDIYRDASTTPRGLPLVLAANPHALPPGLHSILAPRGPVYRDEPVRVAYVLPWPTRGAVVRVERIVDLRTPTAPPAPPTWLLNGAYTLQKSLATDRPGPRSHETSLRDVANDLMRYYSTYGHCHVRQRDPDWRALGNALDRLRTASRRAPARALRFEKVCRELHPALTLWDTDTPVEHAPDPHDLAASTAKHGVFHDRWLDMYRQLERYHAQRGDSNVRTKGWPAHHPFARLGRWVHWQRVRKRDGSILPEQVDLLCKLHFDFEPRQRRTAD
jgi:hypothetical protein